LTVVAQNGELHLVVGEILCVGACRDYGDRLQDTGTAVATPASYKLDTCDKDGGAEQYSHSSHNDLSNCLATWLNSASQ